MNLTPFNKNGGVEGFCLIKALEKKINIKGVPYLDMVLADKSGEITAKLWDYKEEFHGMFETGRLVKVRGTVTPFNDADQLRIEKIRLTIPSDDVKPEDFVPSAEYSGEEMLAEVLKTVEVFVDAHLKKLVTAVLEEYKPKLVYWPAAFKLHHAVRGGLLYHMLTMLRLAQSVSELYPSVDADLLYAGVILHDIAKTEEFIVPETGIASGYTTDGNLVGHIARGAMAVDRIGTRLGTPPELLTLLEHMVLSHHGEPDYGAAVRPMFLEADILSQLDLLDSRIYAISQAVSEVGSKDFTGRQWFLDNRMLYNHGRKETKPKAELLDRQEEKK